MTSYKFVRLLNEGAFGRVYLAEHVQSGQHVAIKELKRLDSGSRVRFARELRLLTEQVDNQFVVDVLDYNLEAHPPAIVMEYCDGGSLRPWVQELQPWLQVTTALGHVAQGLAGIHQAGGFHRDIKPDNLLLAVDGEEATVKIADFGLARLPHDSGSTMTYGGFGTPGYIAPEILMGGDFHSGADIYSLGVVALELLTGTTEPAALDRVAVPQQLKNLVRVMLARAASKRPNIQRVAKMLNDIIGTEADRESAPTTPSRLDGAARKRAALAIGVGAAALAVLGGLAYLAANAPEWDERVQRSRNRDGRFRSG